MLIEIIIFDDQYFPQVKKNKGKLKGKNQLQSTIFHGTVLEERGSKYLVSFTKDSKLAQKWLPVACITATTVRLQTALQEQAKGIASKSTEHCLELSKKVKTFQH
jgi:hypothetical protein